MSSLFWMFWWSPFGRPLAATPHVLSQAGDLKDHSGIEREHVRQFFKDTVEVIDDSVAAVCEQNILVMAADVRLHLAPEVLGYDSINLNHVW